ncbi:TIGR04255 family protein [Candidatus Collinsella stercoripullorum]|uniref:TIGR04255 family protein n=1 Tax=Candidatus Collinsella stercoripullorum TaxID=2838522 RepID=UPI0022E0ACC5|nr:TIGR04255 family protein [Candidatus Collinsella stercoripullorum]
MRFRDDSKPRSRYVKCPLCEVVCQLRYPIILSIDKNLPVDFQEYLRDEYPEYTTNIERQHQVGFVSTPSGVIAQPAIQQETMNHCFSSPDGNWKVNLTSSFVALSTNAYSTWEDFREKLWLPVTALTQCYHPAYCTRVGLRYVDVYDRAKLGVQGTPWRSLFREQILGMAAVPDNEADIQTVSQHAEIKLDEYDAIMRVITNFGAESSSPNTSPRDVFIVDTDTYSLKRFPISKEGVEDCLNFMHDNSTEYGRWMITDELFSAMNPEAISGEAVS